MVLPASQSFFLGVTTALSAVLAAKLYQDSRQRRKKSRSTGTWNNVSRSAPPRSTTTTSTSRGLAEEASADTVPLMDAPDLDLRLIRKAEAVIQGRSGLLTLVIERCTNDHNYSAILRTAEALGIQNVFIIDPPQWTELDSEGKEVAMDQDENASAPINRNRKALKLTTEEIEQRQQHRLFAQNATEWLTLREFATTTECVQALRESDHQIWVTDLSQQAVPLVPDSLDQVGCWPLPRKVAIVFGTEAVGCSQEMLDAADLRVYLPLRGFADSLNLSVATALIVHQLFVLEPSLAGSMTESERVELRTAWFSKLAKQRLLTGKDKKNRRKLLNQIEFCNRMDTKSACGQSLTIEQKTKCAKRSEYQAALDALEKSANYSDEAAVAAVADLVQNPPSPLSDLRRPDLHRVTFAGKNTKQKNQEHWKDMAATENPHSVVDASSSYFRDRVASVTNNGTV